MHYPAKPFPIRRFGCLVVLVVLGLVLVPVECSTAMGPHSVFTDPAVLAGLQGSLVHPGHDASATEVAADAGGEVHAHRGHEAAAPQPAGAGAGDAASAPAAADVDTVFGAALPSFAPLSSSRAAPEADRTPSQPAAPPERGADRPPP